jgi:Flp pilus assembly protein TadG
MHSNRRRFAPHAAPCGVSLNDRRGGVIVLAAAVLVALFAFTAFVVDVGYITLTKAELSKTADGAALAAVSELPYSFGKGATLTQSEAEVEGRNAAIAVGNANVSTNRTSTYLNSTRDVRYGSYTWDSGSSKWIKGWNQQPYNMAEVTFRRNVTGDNGSASTAGDGPLSLFFAPVFGTYRAGTQASSIAAMLPAVGFKITPGSSAKIGILPIALDLDTWNALINDGVGTDSYTYNESSGLVTNGGDGIKEVNLYPNGTADLPPGNRGTVDIGPTNNSTSDLNRQILEGINESDLQSLAAQGVQLRWDTGPIQLNGDPGLSAGIKEELESIKGQPRAIPIFSAVSGPGNNAMYTIVKFVGVRIMFVQLTGKPTSKKVLIQPAPFVEPLAITGNQAITSDTIFGPATLIQ